MNGNDILHGIDRRIAGVLLAHPRASAATVATIAGTSPPTASRHIAALTARGTITVAAVVDREWANAGFTVWLRVRCEPGASRTVAQKIAEWPESGYLAVTGGEVDCVAQVAVRTSAQLLDISARQLRELPGVRSGEMLRVIRRFATPHGWTAGILHTRELTLARADRWDAWTEAGGTRQITTDAVDEAIVTALAHDGRLSWRELGARAGVSSATASRRTEALMRCGPLRLRTVVDPAQVGRPVVALVWLRVLPSRLEVAGRTLADHPDVLSIAATTGRHNLCGEIAVADDDTLYRFLTHDVGAIPGVAEVEVTDGLQVLKRAARVFPTAGGTGFEPVTPRG
ncbi:Lrp/AsnC family transcriptional regulator [Nonomuraea sp. B10E15]|uniref:Lrp/AsnC family transcriptional regulator n=1 Tax=Nonomuraea sp. B10E15 TaxID=3153560 RepID=UPI00325D1BEA